MAYMWGQADMLVLPASFPYGGMENPCMIFLTPSLLTGDRSATSVVAHEISHSWTGNWVSNATWPDVWLNEGWTVWLAAGCRGVGVAVGNRSCDKSWDGCVWLAMRVTPQHSSRVDCTTIQIPFELCSLHFQVPKRGSKSAFTQFTSF